MLKLEKEMPMFLKMNAIILKKDKYLVELPGDFNYYSKAYMTTNENLNSYYDLMDFKDKSILSVIGSGDHIFNAVLNGAKNVDGFDISIYAIMYYYLKEASIKVLDFKTYMTFLFNEKNQNYFSNDIYKKIIPYLNKVALPFWNLVMNSKNKNSFIRNTSKISSLVDDNFDYLSRISKIYTEENYNLLREKLKEVNIRIFLNDFKFLNLRRTYDYIILSNILNYFENEEYRKILRKYQKKLSLNGEIKAYLFFPDLNLIRGYDNVTEIPHVLDVLECEHETLFGGNYILTKRR